MKTCPFCKEDVRDDAIKCRHCHSMLVPIQPADPPAADGRVTYILDQDLVRFGKFAAAVLGIFLIVGAFAFGFKLENALDEADKLQDEAEKIKKSIEETQGKLEGATAIVDDLKDQLEIRLAEADGLLGKIRTTHSTAIRLLSEQEQARLARVKSQDPAVVRSNGGGKLWSNGATLRILFMDGNAQQHDQVRELAAEWLQHASLHFDFVDAGPAEIRISFTRPGAWSVIGTDALGIAPNEPTMNLAWLDRRTVLHEFGHALGLVHEHQLPTANIPWNRERIAAEASSMGFPSQLEHNLFTKLAADQIPAPKEFDPDSIMNMAFPPEWTGGLVLGQSEELSPGDKAFIAQLYPRDQAAPSRR